jgi:arylsulfatase A-like enzyme
MVVTERYKYMLHDQGARAEQLADLGEDPGEMLNKVHDAACADVLSRHRELFANEFATVASCY